jgi:hypothetical protein
LRHDNNGTRRRNAPSPVGKTLLEAIRRRGKIPSPSDRLSWDRKGGTVPTEYDMQKLPIALTLAVVLAGPTLAQAASESAKMNGQNPSPTASESATANQNTTTQSHNSQSIRQQVENNLKQSGFTDIKVMPESFLVRAKDKSGNPVMMVINPDSMMAVTEYNKQNGQKDGNKE